MIFTGTTIPGVYVITPAGQEDERGCFLRTFCREEFQSRGLNFDVVQCSTSYNRLRGTLRGLHYQAPPFAEAKLVRCTAGAVFDVAADLRPQSPAYMSWTAAELSATNRNMMYLPEGVAHGFQTLTDGAEVFYEISAAYHPSAARNVRWDDPDLAINWPLPPGCISPRDLAAPHLINIVEPSFLFNEGVVNRRVTYWPAAFLRRG